MNKKLIVFIAGYSRVGKSTLIANLPYPSVSTSEVLTELTLNVLQHFVPEFANYSKARLRQEITEKKPESLADYYRQSKIKMAEGCIVPVLGRKALIQGALDQVDSAAEVILWETIGGEELNMTMGLIDQSLYRVYGINCTHVDGLIGVDSRESIGRGMTSHWEEFTDYLDYQMHKDTEIDVKKVCDLIKVIQNVKGA